jgi:hypothetical protein
MTLGYWHPNLSSGRMVKQPTLRPDHTSSVMHGQYEPQAACESGAASCSLDLLPLPFPHTVIGGLGSKFNRDWNVPHHECCTD